MRIIRLIVAIYFLISLRALGQEVFDGTATLLTYAQIVLAVTIIGGCIAYPRLLKAASPKQ
jgi:uncharacterized membrane protein